MNSVNRPVSERLVEVEPCHKESAMTNDCLEKNNYERGMCVDYFQNYKVCKTFWMNVRIARRRAGISPTLPPPEERPDILKKYRETNEIPVRG